MIKHVVVWKLKDEALGNKKEENAKKMKQMIEALKSEIDGIIDIKVGINEYVDKNPNADVVLISTHKDLEALFFYQNHPKHIEVANFVKEVVESRACVDFKEDD